MIHHFLDLFYLSAARLFVGLLTQVPEERANRLAGFFVRTVVRCMPRYRKAAERNLRTAFPEKSESERRDIFTRSLDVLARNLVTFARLPKLDRATVEKMLDYNRARALLRSMREKSNGSGVLILTLHFGCFELLAQVHAVLDRPSDILARDFGYPRLDSWWKARRERFGSQVFSRAGGYRQIVKRLKAGRDVAVLFDQNVKRAHAAFVDFFGVPTATTKATGIAALRSKSAIVVCALVERAPNRFEVLFEEVPNPSTEWGTNDVKVVKFLGRVNQVAERFIRENPEQWFWIHRRFKTRPAGEPEDFYD